MVWEYTSSPYNIPVARTLILPIVCGLPTNISMLWDYAISQTVMSPCAFPYLYRIMKPIHPMLWELHRFLVHAEYVSNHWLWNVCIFPYFFRTIGIHFRLVLGTTLLMWKLINNAHIRSHFHPNVYVKLFIKKLIYFVADTSPISAFEIFLP